MNPQALHCDDPVTGLPGRGALERTLSAAIDAAERSGSAVGLVLVDIAELHLINEAHGHDVGDRVLQEAAGAVRASLPQSASLFRLAGGELAAVMADTDSGGLQELQEQLVRAVRKPLQVDRGQLLIAASSGLALFPRHAATAPELLRAACSALNDAKCVGVGAARVGSRVSDSLEHLDLVARLHRARERSELDL
ncbi:MAG: GGDEF domain-containing protein, partial [Gammaproteobacteria bacterium]